MSAVSIMSAAAVPVASAVVTRLTAEEFLQLDDVEGPVELVRGRVVEMPTPMPRHGQICGVAAFELTLFARQNDLGHVLTNDSTVVTKRNPDTVRGADVCFYSYANVPKGPLPAGYLPVPPDLVIEVRSPDDRWRNIHEKVGEYQGAGVSTVCVLDAGTETAHLYFADRDDLKLRGDEPLTFEALPGFAVPVSRFFA